MKYGIGKKTRQSFCILNRMLKNIERVMAYLAGFLICFMVCIVCYEIVLRYFFNKPTRWVIGLTEYIMLYVTFLGTAWLLRKDLHVKIDIVLHAISFRWLAFLNIITSFLCLGSCVAMCWYGVTTTWNAYCRNIMTAQDPEIPKFIILTIIPIAFFLLSIEFAKRIFKALTDLNRSLE